MGEKFEEKEMMKVLTYVKKKRHDLIMAMAMNASDLIQLESLIAALRLFISECVDQTLPECPEIDARKLKEEIDELVDKLDTTQLNNIATKAL